MTRLPVYGTQGKFTFRLLAMALFGQAIILSFFALVARGNAIADGRPDDGQQLLWVGLGLALVALVASGLMRRPYGVTLGCSCCRARRSTGSSPSARPTRRPGPRPEPPPPVTRLLP